MLLELRRAAAASRPRCWGRTLLPAEPSKPLLLPSAVERAAAGAASWSQARPRCLSVRASIADCRREVVQCRGGSRSRPPGSGGGGGRRRRQQAHRGVLPLRCNVLTLVFSPLPRAPP